MMPSGLVVIDASVWVSRLLPTDANHQRAIAWVDNHIMNGGSFAAPLILVIEIAASVSRNTGNPLDARIAVRQLYLLPNMQLLAMDQPLVNESTDLAADYGLRGADAMYVAVAKRLGVSLVTFDGYQLKTPA